MERESKGSLWEGIFFLVISLYWFGKVVFTASFPADPPWIFLDAANLIFHEAGHFIFMFFGYFLHVAGGSILQLLVPLLVVYVFWREQRDVGLGFGLFWLGESASNLSYYIADARTQTLPLLTGDTDSHDWYWILNHLGLLESDTLIGGVLHIAAVILMIVGIIWMAKATYQLYMDQ